MMAANKAADALAKCHDELNIAIKNLRCAKQLDMDDEFELDYLVSN